MLQRSLDNLEAEGRSWDVKLLGIACALPSANSDGGTGLPYSELGEPARGTWVRLATFAGDAAPLDGDGFKQAAKSVTVAGTCALAIAGDRLIAILESDDERRALTGLTGQEPTRQDRSVWISIPVAELRVAAAGEQGLFSKRPALIQIHATGWQIELQRVMRFTRAVDPDTAFRRNSAQPRAEKSIVQALQ